MKSRRKQFEEQSVRYDFLGRTSKERKASEYAGKQEYWTQEDYDEMVKIPSREEEKCRIIMIF